MERRKAEKETRKKTIFTFVIVRKLRMHNDLLKDNLD